LSGIIQGKGDPCLHGSVRLSMARRVLQWLKMLTFGCRGNVFPILRRAFIGLQSFFLPVVWVDDIEGMDYHELGISQIRLHVRWAEA